MIREIQYTIQGPDHEKQIGTFLKEKAYSRGVLIELKKTPKGIRKNGRWAGVNEVLKTGDTLAICLEEDKTSQNITPIEGELEILYEDEDILILNKPHNMPIHPSINHYEQTLANRVVAYYKQQEKSCVFRCINRLDRDTTGITIIAKHMLSASILSNKLKDQTLGRTYIAFVEGEVAEKGCIRLPIGRVEGSIIERKVDHEAGKEAITYYQRLEVLEVEGQKVSIVALRLETGRTHQIRVHMTYLGHPLLGDFLYNPDNHLLNRQGLHAVQMTFHHPITGEYMEVIAPLPKDMSSLIAQAGLEECQLIKRLKKLVWQ